MRNHICIRICLWSTGLILMGSGLALGAVQEQDAVDEPPAEMTDDQRRIADAIDGGVRIILEMQEGESDDQWPYQGVYRVGGEIPIGYRVGGTGIAASALILAPGYDDDPDRRRAVYRATEFIVSAIDHPLMAHQFEAGYDVRGWGYAYGLDYLLRLKRLDRAPDDLGDRIEAAIRFYIDGIEATVIPENGGWNYARRAGFSKPGRPSPFMTAPTLQALFAAVAQGYRVNEDMITSGLDALEGARTPSGAIMYAGHEGESSNESVPGSVGRMLVAESTLFLAERSNRERVRGAIDAFIVHWQWLDKRRAQTGTHVRPYSIAPYYFYYAHYYAAMAVELLPPRERAEYRRRINDLLFANQLDDGSWNDRVFPRSANYGTAMAIQALMMPEREPPARWTR